MSECNAKGTFSSSLRKHHWRLSGIPLLWKVIVKNRTRRRDYLEEVEEEVVKEQEEGVVEANLMQAGRRRYSILGGERR